MWIVAIAALHSTFENLVMKRQIELVLRFGMTANTKLRVVAFQQLESREARLLSVRIGDENVRTGHIPPSLWGMRCVAIRTTDVISPMLTTPEVVVLFSAGMTGKTGLRGCLGRFILE